MGNRIGWILLCTGAGLALFALFALPWYAGDAWVAGHNHTVPCAALVGDGCVVSDANSWVALTLTVAAFGLAAGRVWRPRWGALWCVGVGISGIGIASAAFTASYSTFSWFPASAQRSRSPDLPDAWNPGNGLILIVLAAAFVVAAAVVWLFAGSEPDRRLVVQVRSPLVVAAWAALGGALLALLGSFMPWHGAAASGGDTPAPAVSALAVCAAVMAVAYLRRGGPAWTGALLLTATVVTSIAAEQLAALTGPAPVRGLYLCLAGGLIAALSAAVLLVLECAPSSLRGAAGLGSIMVLAVGVVISTGAAHIAARPAPCSAGEFGITANGQAFSRCITTASHVGSP